MRRPILSLRARPGVRRRPGRAGPGARAARVGGLRGAGAGRAARRAVMAAMAGLRQAAIAAHIGFLASPALEGRGLGARGLDGAAEYVAASLALAGIAPLPQAGGGIAAAPYFHPVAVREIRRPSGRRRGGAPPRRGGGVVDVRAGGGRRAARAASRARSRPRWCSPATGSVRRTRRATTTRAST